MQRSALSEDDLGSRYGQHDTLHLTLTSLGFEDRWTTQSWLPSVLLG